MIHNPDFSRRSLASGAKLLVREDDQDRLLNSLRQLEKQGHMLRCSSPERAKIWAKALERAKDEHLKFALNSAVDCLPHNANLALWRKRNDDTCPLCGERQTLIHILNICKSARDARRFNARHELSLQKLCPSYQPILHHLPTSLLTWVCIISLTILCPLTSALILYCGMTPCERLCSLSSPYFLPPCSGTERAEV